MSRKDYKLLSADENAKFEKNIAAGNKRNALLVGVTFLAEWLKRRRAIVKMSKDV
ncbi:hypothetical protein [Lapidilactobacillus gannanensis]|uniref:hypothetical protein n=1 Tax=Lapidilactobacillus gannanensis TaxID=2486002 RepID=UPI0013DE366A|nr:hypothetical protein [Lapidilactobacillus gannanensis]